MKILGGSGGLPTVAPPAAFSGSATHTRKGTLGAPIALMATPATLPSNGGWRMGWTAG
jgi:hypothetical protein